MIDSSPHLDRTFFVSAGGPEMQEGEFGVPEQHFGPLVAGQATPGLKAVNSRGCTLGNIVLHSAHCAAHITTWRAEGTFYLSVF